MNFVYIVEYTYGVDNIHGVIENTVGCHTKNQAKEIAEAIALWVKSTENENAKISIINTVTGAEENYYF